ncbi:MAG: DNA repair exonuclease [Acidimicrobiales bacterium]|jgi:DNA repair exonuclease SbcCD nuclease subunit
MADSPGASFCFLHTADLHLDTPFRDVHDLPPAVADALREASLQAFDSIVELALERKAAFLVVAGDVYDGPERGLRAQVHFHKGLSLLADEGIPSFVVHGNHDPVTTGWSAISSWPQGVTIFRADSVGLVPVERDGAVIATVQGISYATRETTENLSLRFRRPDGPGVHVGLLHCNLDGSQDHDAYSPCSLADLRSARLDYWALGHIHTRRTIPGNGPGDPWIVYSGNSQARSPKPSEQSAKGAVVVHVRDGVVADVEFVPCDRVRFEEIECPIEGLADLPALAGRLADLASERIAAAEGRSVILRARLSGRGELHTVLTRPGACDEILREVRDDTGGRPPFCWWDEIRDETRGVIDRETLRGRGDFAADLVEFAEGVLLDPAVQASLAASVVTQAPGMFAAVLDGIVGHNEHLTRLVDEATTVALDAVTGDEP